METIRVFSPATVANVSCGFDALGFALETLGDEMVFQKKTEKQIEITHIEGASLPFETHKNAAGVVAQLMLEEQEFPFGVHIEIYKKYKPGSGLGSSAASSAGAAFAINELLGKPYSLLELVQFARKGEAAACGSPIADNVAANLYGGFILVRSYAPLEIVSLPTPPSLHATVIHPQIEIKTEDARNVLPKEVPLKKAVQQWSNVGGLISGLYEANYKRIGKSLQDVIVEPYRKTLIPNFDALQKAALEAGALGAGISGSGPSVFALSKGAEAAQKVAKAFREVYEPSGIKFQVYVSPIANEGTRIIKE